MDEKTLKATLITILILAGCLAQAWAAERQPVLGLVSSSAKGRLAHLVIVVQFPDVKPRLPLESIRMRAVDRLSRWYWYASYGQTELAGTMKGPYTLPSPLARYRVSPYNFKVESSRVYRLVADSLSAAEQDGVDLGRWDVVTIVHRAFTRPGKGYGMICYCANPGMLSKVSNRRAAYNPITTRRGTVFKKGVVVMAENFHLGFLAHDLAHAIGGVYRGVRLVGDLYSFRLQSRPRKRFQIHDAAVYMGPWDIMSQHFIERRKPSPGFSLYSRIKLGWLRPSQVELVRPGQTRLVWLAPLVMGGDKVGIKVPLDQKRYLLVENRQAMRLDRMLPASGVMIYLVDTGRQEGWGLVRALPADPSAANFSRAPFGVEDQAKAVYLDQEAGVAVAALARQGDDYLVLVTKAEMAGAARKVAQGLRALQNSPDYQSRLEAVTRLLEQGRVKQAARVVAGP